MLPVKTYLLWHAPSDCRIWENHQTRLSGQSMGVDVNSRGVGRGLQWNRVAWRMPCMLRVFNWHCSATSLAGDAGKKKCVEVFSVGLEASSPRPFSHEYARRRVTTLTATAAARTCSPKRSKRPCGIGQVLRAILRHLVLRLPVKPCHPHAVRRVLQGCQRPHKVAHFLRACGGHKAGAVNLKVIRQPASRLGIAAKSVKLAGV